MGSTAFKDRSWEARFTAMGDEAETRFEMWAAEQDRGFVRFGLNRPPLRMSSLPAQIRYTPDYLMSNHFVEVQGLGADQTFKLKDDKWDALEQWHYVHPVKVYVWDSYNQRECIIDFDDLATLLNTHGKTAMFPEGKPYTAVAADVIFNAAT